MKKSTEKKAAPRGKLHFNVIDVLIIILLIACVGGVVIRYTVLDSLWSNESLKEYYIDFKASSLTYEQCLAISDAKDDGEAGNWVYFNDGKTYIGKLTNIGEQNRENLIFTAPDGSLMSVPYSDDIADEDVTWTITGTIRCSGAYISDSSGFLLNGKEYLGANMSLDVQTKYADFTLTVTGIEESKDINTDK